MHPQGMRQAVPADHGCQLPVPCKVRVRLCGTVFLQLQAGMLVAIFIHIVVLMVSAVSGNLQGREFMRLGTLGTRLPRIDLCELL